MKMSVNSQEAVDFFNETGIDLTNLRDNPNYRKVKVSATFYGNCPEQDKHKFSRDERRAAKKAEKDQKKAERQAEREARKVEWKKLGETLNFPKRWYKRFKDWRDRRRGVTPTAPQNPTVPTGPTGGTQTPPPPAGPTGGTQTPPPPAGPTGGTNTPPAPSGSTGDTQTPTVPTNANLEALKRNKKALTDKLEELDEKIEIEFAKIPMDVAVMKDLYAQKDRVYAELMDLEKRILQARLDFAKENSKVTDEEMINNLKNQKEVLEGRIAKIEEDLAVPGITEEVAQRLTAEKEKCLEALDRVEKDLARLQQKAPSGPTTKDPDIKTNPIQGIGTRDDRFIPGTEMLIPRKRNAEETIDEYEEYLANHYRKYGIENPIEFYPNTDIKKPRRPYPHELIKYTPNGMVIDGTYIDPYYDEMLNYYAEEVTKTNTTGSPEAGTTGETDPDIGAEGIEVPVVNPISYGPVVGNNFTDSSVSNEAVTTGIEEAVPNNIYGKGKEVVSDESVTVSDDDSVEIGSDIPSILGGLDEGIERLKARQQNESGVVAETTDEKGITVSSESQDDKVVTVAGPSAEVDGVSEVHTAAPEVPVVTEEVKRYTEVKPRVKPVETPKIRAVLASKPANKTIRAVAVGKPENKTIKAVVAGKPKAQIKGVKLKLKGVQSIVRIANTIAKDIDVITKRRVENNTTLIIIKSQTALYQAKLRTIGDAKQSLEQVKSDLQMRSYGNGRTEIEIPANTSYEIDIEPVGLRR